MPANGRWDLIRRLKFMYASLILRETEATAASSTRYTVHGMFYKKQVLQRDEVCPYSLNVSFSLH